MSEPLRSFIAFDVDDDEVLKKLSKVQETLVKTGADLKLVKPQNIHVTMRFLGNIQPNLVEKIHNAMAQYTFAPFDIEIRGIGVFPTVKYVRVVWAGIQNGAEKLEQIFNQLEPRLRTLGFKPDTKGFNSHITIARVRAARNKAQLIRCINELADYTFGVYRLNCLKLKRSVLTPKGPEYSTLKEVWAETGRQM